MDYDQRVASPEKHNGSPGGSRPNSRTRPNASREGSAASHSSGVSLRSNHSNSSSLALRTGRDYSGKVETERTSTPTTVLPPIGQQEDINNSNDASSQSSQTGRKASPTAMDKTSGTGESVPKVARGFRRETSTEHRSQEPQQSYQPYHPKSFKRSVSFGRQHRKTYDGREVTLQSFETQTDWDWLEDAMLDESVKMLEPRHVSPVHHDSDSSEEKTIEKQLSTDSPAKIAQEDDLDLGEKEEEEGPLPYPYSNDEFGIPLLELSSDSDDSSDDESQKPKPNESKLLPSVGPPQILQYIRESEQSELKAVEPPISETIDTGDYPQDETGKVHGYFSGTCEFCFGEILEFPTPEEQQQLPPEELFCCEEYRQFIETMLAEDQATPTEELIDVKPHPHYGSKKARKVAQQKAQLRMRERQLLRQQQNISAQSTSQQSSYYQSSSRQSRTTNSGASERPALSVNKDISTPAAPSATPHHVGLPRPSRHNAAVDHAHPDKPTPAIFNVLPPDQRGAPLITTTADGDQTGLDVPDRAIGPPSTSIRPEIEDNEGESDTEEPELVESFSKKEETVESVPHVKKTAKVVPLVNLPASVSSSKDSDLDSMATKREKKTTLETPKASKKKPTESSMTSSSEVLVPKKKLLPLHDRDVARQMKTINYQLSSQRCLEEGWTVRPPSPMILEEAEEVFIPEPLDPAFAATGKTRKRELIQKFYDDGQPFITIFPDGSGNVFYSSGHVAVVISCQEPGQYNYLVMEDDPGPPPLGLLPREPQVLGLFSSDGHASCCYTSGKLRLFLDQFGGIELDREGAKRKKWSWNDMETHVHAPPFQPVCFALNSNIAIRVMTQETMSLTFRCKNRSCRLPVGAKLKLVSPENLPPKEIDSDVLFISEKKALTQTLLNRISNLLRFPKSPKVEKILPPLHITSKIHKNEKMQQQREEAMAAAQAKRTKQRLTRSVVVS